MLLDELRYFTSDFFLVGHTFLIPLSQVACYGQRRELGDDISQGTAEVGVLHARFWYRNRVPAASFTLFDGNSPVSVDEKGTLSWEGRALPLP